MRYRGLTRASPLWLTLDGSDVNHEQVALPTKARDTHVLVCHVVEHNPTQAHTVGIDHEHPLTLWGDAHDLDKLAHQHTP